jgi:hypothetical protein
MNGFFDSSVLAPVFYGDHVHHKASLDLLIRFNRSTGCCGAHSLAEVYSTLTRMPGKHRISGDQAMYGPIIVEIRVDRLREAVNPQEDILLQPLDVVSVEPAADRPTIR